jgi:hypothetical protein
MNPPTALAGATSATSSLAASSKFRTFAITFAVAGTLIYLLCLFFNWPLFTFHPATNRFVFGWEASRSGEGPAMYWYGWTATGSCRGSGRGLPCRAASGKQDEEVPAGPGLAASDLGDPASDL